jgi:hypothetical protein
MSTIIFLVIAAAAVVLALALAYVPMRLLVGHMAANIRHLIQRTRERRTASRDTPDRRKAEPGS